MTPLFKATIPGRVVSKKNSKRIVSRAKKPFLIASEQYLGWARLALLEVKSSAVSLQPRPFEESIELHIRFFFKNHQHELDLDNCLGGPLDVLQKARVIKDDKQVLKIRAEKFFGHEPRVEIELFEYKQGA